MDARNDYAKCFCCVISFNLHKKSTSIILYILQWALSWRIVTTANKWQSHRISSYRTRNCKDSIMPHTMGNKLCEQLSKYEINILKNASLWDFHKQNNESRHVFVTIALFSKIFNSTSWPMVHSFINQVFNKWLRSTQHCINQKTIQWQRQ